MSNSNIQAVTKTVDAHAIAGRTRVAGIYFTNTATAGTITLRNGSVVGATAVLTLNTPAVAGANDILLPDMGILFDSGVFIDVSGVEITSVTLFFYGGAAQ